MMRILSLWPHRSQVMGIRGSALSLAVLLAPLSQAAVSQWIAPQISFAIGGGLALFIALFAAFALKTHVDPERITGSYTP